MGSHGVPCLKQLGGSFTNSIFNPFMPKQQIGTPEWMNEWMNEWMVSFHVDQKYIHEPDQEYHSSIQY